jgi:hypothetical protein
MFLQTSEHLWKSLHVVFMQPHDILSRPLNSRKTMEIYRLTYQLSHLNVMQLLPLREHPDTSMYLATRRLGGVRTPASGCLCPAFMTARDDGSIS